MLLGWSYRFNFEFLDQFLKQFWINFEVIGLGFCFNSRGSFKSGIRFFSRLSWSKFQSLFRICIWMAYSGLKIKKKYSLTHKKNKIYEITKSPKVDKYVICREDEIWSGPDQISDLDHFLIWSRSLFCDSDLNGDLIWKMWSRSDHFSQAKSIHIWL